MRYMGIPMGMWVLFAGSFRAQLTETLGFSSTEAGAAAGEAKRRYRQIIAELPPFERADRFQVNLVSCAMLGAFLLSLPQCPDVELLTDYYARAMMIPAMKWFCRKSGKNKFTKKELAGLRREQECR